MTTEKALARLAEIRARADVPYLLDCLDRARADIEHTDLCGVHFCLWCPERKDGWCKCGLDASKACDCDYAQRLAKLLGAETP